MNCLVVILTDERSEEVIKKKILHLIQQWGLQFEGSTVYPLFNQLYLALDKKLGGFPDEAEARAKLAKSKKKPEGSAKKKVIKSALK